MVPAGSVSVGAFSDGGHFSSLDNALCSKVHCRHVGCASRIDEKPVDKELATHIDVDYCRAERARVGTAIQ